MFGRVVAQVAEDLMEVTWVGADVERRLADLQGQVLNGKTLVLGPVRTELRQPGGQLDVLGLAALAPR